MLQGQRLIQLAGYGGGRETATIFVSKTVASPPPPPIPNYTLTVDVETAPDDDIDCSIADDACIERLAAIIRRVWSHRSVDTWCAHQTINSTAPPTLTLVKVPKSASSTAAALVLRIQALHHCAARWEHGRAADTVADRRAVGGTAATSFLLAPVRQPEQRALSSVYFHQVSFHRKNNYSNNNHTSRTGQAMMPPPADSYILKHLREIPPNFISDYMRLRDDGDDRVNLTTSRGLQKYVSDILSSYDFILVTTRMDESAVVLSLLTALPLSTVLTTSSKQAGSWYYSGGRCLALVPASSNAASSATAHYFQSVEWKTAHAADRLLFAAANQSLDATIAALGGGNTDDNYNNPNSAPATTPFRTRLADYRRLQAVVQTACANETHYPCSARGTPQLALARRSCYARDFGCGHTCVDRVVAATVH